MLLSLRQPAVALAGILASILFPFRAAAAPEFDFDDNCMAPRNSVALTVQSSLFPSLPGQAVTLTAFVEPIFTADTAPGTADPSGTVQLSDGLTDLGTFNLRLGQVSTTIVFNDAGAHSIFATYSGDPSYCGASVRFGQQVDRFVTTLNLTSSAPASAFGQAVTFTARLGPPAPAGVVGPTGQVQFFDGSTPIGTVTPVAASATLTVAGLGAGSHQISAMYSGDFNWFSVRSAALAQTVNRAPTVTALSATSTVAQSTVTVTVSTAAGATTPGATIPGGTIPGGSVQLVDAASSAVFGAAPLPAGAAAVSFSVNASQIAGRPVTAIYSGDANFAPSTSASIGIPALINASGATSLTFAPDELVSLFGPNLANATLQASTVPLPGSLAGDSIIVTDSAGVARSGGLYLVSPGQINFVIPAGAAPGTARVALINANGAGGVVPIQVTIGSVAPGLFTAAANGKGLAAAQIIRVHADGTQTVENVSTAPIDIGSDSLYLVLYATGIRNRSAAANVTCTINSLNLPVSYAGAQPQFPGLDQADVLLPATLKAAGQVNVALMVDGQVSNTVSLTFQ